MFLNTRIQGRVRQILEIFPGQPELLCEIFPEVEDDRRHEESCFSCKQTDNKQKEQILYYEITSLSVDKCVGIVPAYLLPAPTCFIVFLNIEVHNVY